MLYIKHNFGFWGLEPLLEKEDDMAENGALGLGEKEQEHGEAQPGQSKFERWWESRGGPLFLMLILGIVVGYLIGSSGFSELKQKFQQDEVAFGFISKGYLGTPIVPSQIVRSQDPLFVDGEEKWPAGSLLIFTQKGNDLIITPRGGIEVYKEK